MSMKIKLEEYTPQWKLDFEKEKKILSKLLKEIHPVIEHIGSTSIPDFIAKPIVDILIGIKDEDDFEFVIGKLINEGYSYLRLFNFHVPERRFFIKFKEGEILKHIDTSEDLIKHDPFERLFQVHCVEFNSPFWNRHVDFRNVLLKDETLRNEYGNLKIDIVKNNWINRIEYARAKSDFINKALGLAPEAE